MLPPGRALANQVPDPAFLPRAQLGYTRRFTTVEIHQIGCHLTIGQAAVENILKTSRTQMGRGVGRPGLFGAKQLALVALLDCFGESQAGFQLLDARLGLFELRARAVRFGTRRTNIREIR